MSDLAVLSVAVFDRTLRAISSVTGIAITSNFINTTARSQIKPPLDLV
ncbi:hypothetical protein QUA56_20190 [Microcoleus sp. N3A4]